MNSKIIKDIMLLSTVLFSVYSCTPHKNIHGILISDYDVDNIVIGETNINYFIQKHYLILSWKVLKKIIKL